MGHAELAELKYAQKEDISDLLREVLKAGSRAKDLVQQILTFSRQTEGKKVPVDLPPLVKEALKFLRASIPANIEIQQNMDPEGCLVMADPTNLHQVIMNLCTNAAHAMRETGGTLRVEVSKVNLEKEASDGHTGLPPGPYVKLVVSDTGYGIDKQVKERLFDPFFTTKRQGEGTGLGLSVVHGIIKDLGGSIEVESEPGQGATFQVFMPQHQGGVHSEPETVVDDLPRLKGHILLVDDEMGVLNSGQALLEVLGCKVSAFSVSRQALEAFEQSPNDFDVVITDLSMPGMTGLELTRRVKMARPDIPIIMWTGFSDKLNASNFAAYGLDAVLMKPPLISDLAEVLRQAGLGQNSSD
jgi:CheY-like chemotaxis protein